MRNRRTSFFRYPQNIPLVAAGCLVCVFALADAAWAQSTLEYTALTGAVTAAAAAEEEKPKDSGDKGEGAGQDNTAADVAGEAIAKIYGESSEALSTKGAALLGQLGGPSQAQEATAAAQDAPRTAEPRMIEFEDQEGPPADEEKGAADAPAGQGLRIFLKDGHVVEGKLLEEAGGHYRIQTGGLDLTYFKDEIQKTEKF
jgi:hypothetical protein